MRCLYLFKCLKHDKDDHNNLKTYLLPRKSTQSTGSQTDCTYEDLYRLKQDSNELKYRMTVEPYVLINKLETQLKQTTNTIQYLITQRRNLTNGYSYKETLQPIREYE